MAIRWTAAAACILTFLVSAGTARAGLVLQSREGETLISRERIAMPADEVKMVLDGREKTYLMINPREKLYAQGPLTEYCEMFEKLREALAEMMQDGAATPAQPARYAVEALGRGDPVSGFAVNGYRILKNGEPEADLWVATGKEIERETLDLGKIVADFMSCVTGSGGAILAYREVFRKGVPVRQVSYEDGRPSEDGAPVTAIEVRDVPDSAFEPPAGYREVPLAQVMGGEEGSAQPAYTGPPPEVGDLIAPPVPLNAGGRQMLAMKGVGEADRLREIPLRADVGLPAMPGAYFTMGATGTSDADTPTHEAYLVTTRDVGTVDRWYRDQLPGDWERDDQGKNGIWYRPKGAHPVTPPYVWIQEVAGPGMDLMFADLPGARTRIVLGYWEGGTPPPEAASAAPAPAASAPSRQEAPVRDDDGNPVVQDAKEVGEAVVDDTRNEVKDTVRETANEQVKSFLKGLFK